MSAPRPEPTLPVVESAADPVSAERGLALPLALRLRGYAMALALTFLSVPFLHLYLAVDLSPGELLVHAIDIALSLTLALAALEGAMTAAQRRLTWRFEGIAGWLVLGALPLGMVLAWAALTPVDWLPGTGEIRHKHAASGYGDMSLRVLPLGLLILYLAFEATRRVALREELSALRSLNRALLAREARAQVRPEPGGPPVCLGLEGREIRVAPRSVVRVQAQENYCEFVLGEGEHARRPLVRMTLAEAAELLPGDLFLQTHRSHLANLSWVREWVREGRRAALRLANGEQVPVARARVAEVRDRLARFAGDGAD